MGLYFGEIHIHSNLSDGRGSPAQNLRYARDVAGLDFGAITDHAEDLDKRKWNRTKEEIQKYNNKSEFVTLLAFEWTHPSGLEVWKPLVQDKLDPSQLTTDRWGHRNVYYKGIEGNFYQWKDDISNTPEKLFNILKKQNIPALVIPHHPASYVFPVDWEKHNSEFERLVEIYSMWGSSEMHEREGNRSPIIRGGGEVDPEKESHVIDALKHGCKLGLIAGSDGHDGFGGKTRHHISNLTEHQGPFYPSGIVATYAEELSRESIWNALWDRNCYGTTGQKIRLHFTVNGERMGSEINVKQDEEITVKAKVSGTADIQKVEVIENGEIGFKKYGNSPEVNLKSKSRIKNGYIYVRVFQTDGGMAWSSPIWVSGISP